MPKLLNNHFMAFRQIEHKRATESTEKTNLSILYTYSMQDKQAGHKISPPVQQQHAYSIS